MSEISSSSSLSLFVSICDYTYAIRAADQQTQAYLITAQQTENDIKICRSLLNQLHDPSPDEERKHFERIINQANSANEEIARLLEPARVDVDINGNIQLATRCPWVLSDNASISAALRRSSIIHKTLKQNTYTLRLLEGRAKEEHSSPKNIKQPTTPEFGDLLHWKRQTRLIPPPNRSNPEPMQPLLQSLSSTSTLPGAGVTTGCLEVPMAGVSLTTTSEHSIPVSPEIAPPTAHTTPDMSKRQEHDVFCSPVVSLTSSASTASRSSVSTTKSAKPQYKNGDIVDVKDDEGDLLGIRQILNRDYGFRYLDSTNSSPRTKYPSKFVVTPELDENSISQAVEARRVKPVLKELVLCKRSALKTLSPGPTTEPSKFKSGWVYPDQRPGLQNALLMPQIERGSIRSLPEALICTPLPKSSSMRPQSNGLATSRSFEVQATAPISKEATAQPIPEKASTTMSASQGGSYGTRAGSWLEHQAMKASRMRQSRLVAMGNYAELQ